MDREIVNVADLKLDGQNPRHEPTKSQRDIVDALLNKDGSKVVRLAEDIASFGLSPIEDLLVLKEPGPSYTVIEGNRRLAAIKLLANPSVTSLPRYQKRFLAIKKRMTADPIHELDVAIAHSRAEAKPWQQRRHMGEAGGIGVVRWDAEASTRFFGRRGTQADRAIRVIEALEDAYPGKTAIIDGLKDIRKNRLTTFGRLVSDPFVRGKLGLEMSPEVGARYTSGALEPAFGKIVDDLTKGAVTVSGLKSKDQRRKYVLGLGLPDERTADTEARPLVPAGTPKPKPPKPKPPKVIPPTGPKPLFDGVALTNLGGRIASVLQELQKLDVDKYPNACGALLRVVIELSVTHVYEKKGWTGGYLAELVRKCLKELDPSMKDPKYQSVRAGLSNPNSLFAPKTIHAYLHNAHYNPSPSELRATAANYAQFLAGLDTLV